MLVCRAIAQSRCSLLLCRDDVEELDVEVDEEELDNSESEEEEIDEWRVF